MVHKVNIKARIDRHTRIIKESFGAKTKFISLINKKKAGYKFVVFIMVVLIPIYPIFASFVHNNTEYDFYRGYIDETSILGSYDSDFQKLENGENMYEAKDAFFSVSTILDDNRDLAGVNDIVEYKIIHGDSLSSIAYSFQVSTNSIYWANNFSKNHIIHPGDIIKIPPVSGVIHKVQKGDTILSISNKYSVDSKKIIEQNLLVAGEGIKQGDVLVIPGAIKQDEKPKNIDNPRKAYTKAGKTKNIAGQIANTKGSYDLSLKSSGSGFYWGNCTWYVAKYKKVTWRGNANQWLKNAKAQGVATGHTPTVGSIISFNGRGYNPRYGHVGIVMEVKSDHMIVSDMNYRKLNEVTYRKVPINDRAIMGYIYVD